MDEELREQAENVDTPETEQAEEPKKKKNKQDKKSAESDKRVAEAEQAAKDAEAKAAEMNDKFMRIAAEYDNFRRRTAKEKESMYGDGKADAIAAILPVLDNIDRSVATEPDGDEAKRFHEGLQLIARQFRDALSKAGVTEITAVGQPFDPNLHNAIMHVEDETAGENTVVEEFQKGYKLGDRVIRHSMVKVAN